MNGLVVVPFEEASLFARRLAVLVAILALSASFVPPAFGFDSRKSNGGKSYPDPADPSGPAPGAHAFERVAADYASEQAGGPNARSCDNNNFINDPAGGVVFSYDDERRQTLTTPLPHLAEDLPTATNFSALCADLNRSSFALPGTSGSSAAWDPTSNVDYVIGGVNASPPFSAPGNTPGYVPYISEFRGDWEAFQNFGPGAGTATVSDGTTVYVFGGLFHPNFSAATVASQRILRYVPASDTWNVASATLPDSGLYGMAAAFVPPAGNPSGTCSRGCVWLFGGENATNVLFANIYRYDIALDRLIAAPASLPYPLANASAFYDGSRVWLVGGASSTNAATAGNLAPQNAPGAQLLSFDPANPATPQTAASSSAAPSPPWPPCTPPSSPLPNPCTLVGTVEREYGTLTGAASTSGTPLPSPRENVAAVWDSAAQRAYLIGGQQESPDAGLNTSNGPIVSAGTQILEVRVDDSQNKAAVWQVGTLQTPLAGAAAVEVGGNVYVFGGQTPTGPSGLVTAYRPANWAEAVPMPSIAARSFAGAGVVGSSIFIVGGNATISGTMNWTTERSLVAYAIVNPFQANVHGRSFGAVLPSPRAGTSAVYVGGKIWIFGGVGPSGVLSEILSLDTATGEVSKVGSLPGPLAWTSSATDGRYVYIVGGCSDPHCLSGGMSSLVLRFDPGQPGSGAVAIANVYSRTGTPVGLSNASVGFASGALWILGGETKSSANTIVALSDVREFGSPAAAAAPVGLVPVAQLPVATTRAATAVVGSFVYLLGGSTPLGAGLAPSATISRFATTSLGTATPLEATLPEARASASAALLNGHIMVFGGTQTSGSVAARAIDYDPQNDAASEFPYERNWFPTTSVGPLKIGDQFKVHIPMFNVLTASVACTNVGYGLAIAYALRIDAPALGIETGIIDISGDNKHVDVANPDSANGFFTVPAAGTSYVNGATGATATVPAFDASTHPDLVHPGPVPLYDIRVHTLLVCAPANESATVPLPTSVAPATVAASTPNAPIVLEDSVVDIHIPLDNTPPSVILESNAGSVPNGPGGVGVGSYASDPFATPPLGIGQNVALVVLDCDLDFNPQFYRVHMPLAGLNPLARSPGIDPDYWQQSFRGPLAEPACRSGSNPGQGFALFLNVTIADGANGIDGIQGTNGYYAAGLNVTVDDGATAAISSSRPDGNEQTFSLALNVDAVGPAPVSNLNVTPTGGGGAALAFSFDPSQPRNQDAQGVRITYGLANGTPYPQGSPPVGTQTVFYPSSVLSAATSCGANANANMRCVSLPASVPRLSTPISATASKAFLTTTAGFPPAGMVLIDSEIATYASIGGANNSGLVGLARGALNTTAAVHAAGASVMLLAPNGTTVTTAALSAAPATIPVASTSGFPSTGTVLVGGTVYGYGGTSPTALTQLVGPLYGTPATASPPGSAVDLLAGLSLASPLSAAISASATSIKVASTTTFPTSGTAIVDSELVQYTSTDATTLKGVTRGAFGSAATPHSLGSAVSVRPTLTTALTAAGTSMTLADAGTLPASGVVLVDNEAIYYARVSGSQLQGLQRGWWGTTPAAHAAGAGVYQTTALRTLSGGISATSAILPVTFTQGLPPSGNVILGSEIVHYSSVAPNALTGLTRGYFGTTPAAASSGTAVRLLGNVPVSLLPANVPAAALYFRVDSVDDAGNLGVPSANRTAVVVQASPVVVPLGIGHTVGGVTYARLTAASAQVASAGSSMSKSSGIASGQVIVYDPATDPAAPTTSNVVVAPLKLSGGVWSAPLSGLDQQPITVGYVFTDVAGNVASAWINVTRDPMPPSLHHVSAPSTVSQGLPFDINVNASGAQTGSAPLEGMTASLLVDGNAVATKAFCVQACATAPEFGPSAVQLGASADSVYTLSFTGADLATVPPANYTLVVHVFDAAGNEANFTQPVTVGPRVSLLDTTNIPFLNGTQLNATAFSGFTAADGSVRAPSVVLQYLTSDGRWVTLAPMQRTGAPPDASGNYRFVYNTTSLAQDFASLVLRAAASSPKTTAYSAPVIVQTPKTEGVNFSQPISGWAANVPYLTATPGSVMLSLTARASNATAVEYRIVRTSSPAENGTWGLASKSGSGSAATFAFALAWADGSALASGTYLLVVCPVASASVGGATPSCIYPALRAFVVQREPIVVNSGSVRLQGQSLSNAAYVGRTLALSGIAQNGYVAATSVVVTLANDSASSGKFSPFSLNATLTPLSGALAGSTAFSLRTDLTGHSIPGGALVDITIRATTPTEPAALPASVLGPIVVPFDPTSPTANVTVPPPGIPVVLQGFVWKKAAGGASSPIDHVFVTFSRSGDGAWWDGTAWRDPRPGQGTNATVGSCGGSPVTCPWTLSLAKAIDASLANETYSAIAIPFDAAGNQGAPATASFQLDRSPPGIGDFRKTVATASAGGKVVLVVRANASISGIQSVNAAVTLPGGTVETRAFSLLNGSIYYGNWTLTLAGADVPYAGQYVASVEATSRVGLASPAILASFDLADPAPVRFASVSVPSTTQSWEGALLGATVQDAGTVTDVQVCLTASAGPSGAPSSGWLPMAAGAGVDPQTRAGPYWLQTLGNLTLVRGETYQVQFRSQSAAFGWTTSGSLPLAVSSNDRPRLTLVGTRDSGAVWVGVPPVVDWRVLDDNTPPTNLYLAVSPAGLPSFNATSNLTVQLLGSVGGEPLYDARATLPASVGNAGTFTATLRAVDALGASNSSTGAFRVDASPPVVSVVARGTRTAQNVTYVLASTRFVGNASDASSSIVGLVWAVDGVVAATNSSNFTLDWATVADGDHTVALTAEDRAGNTRTAALNVTVDKVPPTIRTLRSSRSLLFQVADGGVGLDPTSFALEVQNLTSSTWYHVPATYNASGGTFAAVLNATWKGPFRFYASVADLAGNMGSDGTFNASNLGFTEYHAPTLVVLAPASGVILRGNATFSWAVDDPQNLPVVVSMRVNATNTTSFPVPIPTGAKSVTLPTTSLRDGPVTVTFVASDGNLSTASTLHLTILNAAQVAVSPPPNHVLRVGEGVTFEIAPRNLTIANVSAELQVFSQVGGWEAVPGKAPTPTAGPSGTYTVAVAPGSSGIYRVLLHVSYATAASADTVVYGPFGVQSATVGAPETTPIYSMAIGAFVLVLAGAAAWAARRWRT